MSEERCTKLGERLSGYHDGVLDPAERAQVETHLAGCAVCRARLAEYVRVDRALGVLAAPELEDRLREELVAYTRESIAVRGRAARRGRLRARLRAPRTWFPLAAAALVTLVVWRGMDHFGGPLALRESLAPRASRGLPESAPPTSVLPDGPPPGALGSVEDTELAPSAPANGLAKKELQEQKADGTPPPTPEGAAGDAATRDNAPGESKSPGTWGGIAIDSKAAHADRERAESEASAPLTDQDEPVAPPAGASAGDRAAGSQSAPPPGVESAPPVASPPPPAPPAEIGAQSQAAPVHAPAPPAPAAPRVAGRLDPMAALSIATLALEVGDLTGARLALTSVPLMPADTLTTRAAYLALVLAARTGDSADCKQARERADVLTAALPSGATVDTLRARRAALQCPP